MGLTVTIEESVTLEDAKFENTTSKTYAGVDHYERRVIPITTTNGGQVLYTCSDGGTGGFGDFDYNKLKYVRMTNLSTGATMYLEVLSGGQYFYFTIRSGGSFIINNHKSFLDGGTNPYANGFVTSVKCEASSASDMEIFMAYED